MPGDGSGSAGTGKDAGVAGTQQGDWAAIEKLENDAKAIAKTTGCATSGECRSAPVGSKGCGGPRYYIPWCARSTDSAALYAKLDQVVTAERAYNKKYQIISTCEYRLAPTVQGWWQEPARPNNCRDRKAFEQFVRALSPGNC